MMTTSNVRQNINQWIQDRNPVTIHPNESIRDAANKLVTEDVLQVPIVGEKDANKLLGIVTLHDIARQQNAIEDTIRRE